MGPSPEKILMGPSSKKRRYQRYILTFPMDLYRMDYKDNRYDAELIDCCNKGLSLMTNEKLVIGEFIYFELKNCDTNVLLPFIKKKNYIGIVRWGIRYSSTNARTNGLYKYGIELSTNY